MKNKFLRDILTFISVLLALFVFFSMSITDVIPDTEVVIKVNDYELDSKKEKLENDLHSLSSVGSVDISLETETIVLEVDNNIFELEPVKQFLDKWEIDYEEDFDISIIASAL